MYKDKRDGELYEDYENAFNTMLESMDLSDYVEARLGYCYSFANNYR